MAGTREGGLKAKATIERKFGKHFYADNGSKGGGSEKYTADKRPFAQNPELARAAGRKGGQVTRDRKAKGEYKASV